MRVAIITESFPPDLNGVAHCVVRVAELLAAGGHLPIVIAPQPPAAGATPLEFDAVGSDDKTAAVAKDFFRSAAQ